MDLKKVNKSIAFCVIFYLFCLISCDSNKLFDAYQSQHEDGWRADESVQFEVQVSDTLNHYHVFLNLRTDHEFPYRNLFVLSQFSSPKGFVLKDTLEYEMADAYGRWLGEGFTEVKHNKLFFLENYQFTHSGTYTFEFTQAMRKRGNIEGDQVLRGVLDVGLRIEKVEE